MVRPSVLYAITSLAMTLVWLGFGAAKAQDRLPEDTPNDPALNAAEFDALTRGKTFDTYDSRYGLYGRESFFEGQRVIWRDEDTCMEGHWAQSGQLICFTYQDDPQTPDCWTYHDRGGWLMAWLEGDRELAPIMLEPIDTAALSCAGWLGS